MLHVSPYFAPAFVYGGPPRSILGLCGSLARLGITVDVVTTTANGGAPALPAATDTPVSMDGVAVRYFPWSEPRWLWHARGLRAWLARQLHCYDLIHLHGLWHLPGWHAARLARRVHVPYVVSPRGMLEREALAIRRGRKAVALATVERENLTRAAFLHATSVRERDTLDAQAFGPHVVLATNGVDVAEVSSPDPAPTLRAWNLTDRPYLLFLGRVHPIKRLDLLAAAAGKLIHRQVRVVIAGPDEGDQRRAIEPLFRDAGVEVVWTGPVAGRVKADLLAGARALVMCSDSESFGLAAAEALAAGTPVVATRTTAWEQIETAGAGRWVDHNPDAIAAALDAMLADPAAAHAMGQRGRLLAARMFTWSATARVIADAYLAVVVRRPAMQAG